MPSTIEQNPPEKPLGSEFVRAGSQNNLVFHLLHAFFCLWVCLFTLTAQFGHSLFLDPDIPLENEVGSI